MMTQEEVQSLVDQKATEILVFLKANHMFNGSVTDAAVDMVACWTVGIVIAGKATTPTLDRDSMSRILNKLKDMVTEEKELAAHRN